MSVELTGSQIKANNSSTSTSSQSTSLYETPMNSPTNQSSLASTAIDSQFDRTSNITETIDLLDSRQSFESLTNRSVESRPASVETNSTLKAQQFNRSLLQSISMHSTNDEPLNQQTNQSVKGSQIMVSSIPQSSIWFRRQAIPSSNDYIDSRLADDQKYRLLLKYMEELDCEHLQIIGLEQQINSISLQCKTIRENIVSKTNSIYSLIEDMIISKQSTETQTQTQLVKRESETTKKEMELPDRKSKSVSSLVKRKDFTIDSTSMDSIVSTNLREPKKIDLVFPQLSSAIKKKLERLPALVKGYLIRRLMKTDKVLYTIKTIQDTTQLLLNFKNNPPNRDITPEDVNFHKRLIIQLETACLEFYDILINYPKSAQMALISRSREHILERHYRAGSVLSTTSNVTSNLNSGLNTSQTTGLTSVTRKILEKKLGKDQNMPPVNKSKPLSRLHSPKSSLPISSLTKRSSGIQSPKALTEISLSHDSSSRTNPNLRRSQRNTNSGKNKLQTIKRKSPSKRK